jgi:hypothetical protein
MDPVSELLGEYVDYGIMGCDILLFCRWSPTLKTEATSFSETSVTTCNTTLRHKPVIILGPKRVNLSRGTVTLSW